MGINPWPGYSTASTVIHWQIASPFNATEYVVENVLLNK
jgi:hypothetical protein